MLTGRINGNLELEEWSGFLRRIVSSKRRFFDRIKKKSKVSN
jgi:hypothetical protein